MQNNENVDIKQLINLSDAARYCGISRPYFYILLEAGDAPAPVEIGGTRYFSRITLKEWNNRRKAHKKRGSNGAK
jgi:predicted DNA-binding transcriptional regulator AlpA